MQVPVLVDDGLVVAGSASIVEWLGQTSGDPGLVLRDSQQAEAAKGWVDWIDAEVGVDARAALFWDVFTAPKLAAALFTTGQPAWKAALFRRLIPGRIPALRERLGLTRDAAESARKRLAAALSKLSALPPRLATWPATSSASRT